MSEPLERYKTLLLQLREVQGLPDRETPEVQQREEALLDELDQLWFNSLGLDDYQAISEWLKTLPK